MGLYFGLQKYMQNLSSIRTNKYLIIDFDSTLINGEGLEMLAEITFEDVSNRDELVQEISTITNLGMTGEINFKESLLKRLDLFNIHQKHLEKLNDKIIESISKSILREKSFFDQNRENIFIVSGGFKEWILPVTNFLNIKEDHVFANTFVFDNQEVIGIDEDNPLLNSGGKAKIVEGLNLGSERIVVGDGFTDYEIKLAGKAEKFYLYTENITRDDLVEKADFVISDFRELIDREY